MTFTVTTENIYLAIIFILLTVQFFQWRAIFKLRSENDQIWEQLGMLIANIAQQITDIKKRIENEK
jgi:hypothetical protein